ncbi:hypothetical protein [Roseiconus lacunae]|uniref:hypothetical protein n=1 Tax=Roseiconus lacunae TaxID=2605694 RepID=UPI001E3B4F90|nr:hypothetical protein [Roseiconus lacunae]
MRLFAMTVTVMTSDDGRIDCVNVDVRSTSTGVERTPMKFQCCKNGKIDIQKDFGRVKTCRVR